jgi:opacity protein-like surface antigen
MTMTFMRAAACCLSFFFLAQPADAQTISAGSNGYVSIVGGGLIYDGGLDFLDHDLGYTIGGAAGYAIGNWRGEVDVMYSASEFEANNQVIFDMSSIRGTLGLYYDITQLSFLGATEPYLGGGVGVANILVEGTDGNPFEDDNTVLTLHVQTGLNFNVTQNFSIVPDYRFEWYDSGDFATFDEDVIAHSFRVAGRLWF